MSFKPFMQLAALAAVYVVAATAPAQAQQLSVREGARVKITTASQKEVVGVVNAVSGDTLVLFTDPHGARIAFSVPAIQKVEVSRGRVASAGAKKGLLWGAGIGAAATVFALALNGDELIVNEDGTKTSPSEFAALAFFGYAAVGAGIGALVKAEKWDVVPVRAGVSARGRVISLQVSQSFR
ncbi:MAG TPA: hypothetical protein VNJ04_10265 [Gemmatimonadaceae bacterium]|nr:hypothetical protein [Gemmatimonadaceae bacterium]